MAGDWFVVPCKMFFHDFQGIYLVSTYNHTHICMCTPKYEELYKHTHTHTYVLLKDDC